MLWRDYIMSKTTKHIKIRVFVAAALLAALTCMQLPAVNTSKEASSDCQKMMFCYNEDDWELY